MTDRPAPATAGRPAALKVFVSYTEPDRSVAERWVERLRSDGFEVWWDQDGIRRGDEYDHVIREQIKASDVLLALWSHSSLSPDRPWVRAEAKHALECGLPVVSLRLGRCEIPLPHNIHHAPELGDFDTDAPRIAVALRERAKIARKNPPPKAEPGIWSKDYDQVFDATIVSVAVVGAEIPGLAPKHRLYRHVRQAIDRDENAIWSKVQELIEYGRVPNPGEPALAPLRDVKSLRLLPEIDIAAAFDSWEALARTVQIISRADIVLLDLTDYQPGIMLLLGIRAVARKGITINSVGGENAAGYNTLVPFNLQMLNLAFHPKVREGRTQLPRDVIATKIVSGLADLSRLPFYRDLPAFDAVRQIGVEASDFASITYDRRVLALTPFSLDYLQSNWPEVSEELSAALTRHFESLPPEERDDYKRQHDGKPPKPIITQLLEEGSARLVIQTLYEAIRRTQMCVVDFSGLRANVFYELGVRLASNRNGLVCISAEADNLIETDPATKRNDDLAHVKCLRELFEPIHYSVDGSAHHRYTEMIKRFRESLEPAGRPESRIYDAVAEAQGSALYPLMPSVVDELRSSAALAAADPDSRFAGSSVLHHEANRALFESQQRAALERKIAAWLYINRRYSAAAIKADGRIGDVYRSYADHILDSDDSGSDIKILVESEMARFEADT